MEPQATLLVKVATEVWEFDQIHRLNHQTFTHEIPQHRPDPSGLLIDRFHDENTYLIALAGREVVGMLAVREQRPFSLDQKLPDLHKHLPAGRSICELRLLAVHRRYRMRRLLPALLEGVWQHCLARGFDLAVISGVTRQLKLYGHLGFEPFGPLVGTPPALFQPMMLTLERFALRAPKLFRRRTRRRRKSVNLLPGPVDVRPEVSRALRRPARSHRSAGFLADLEDAQERLCTLVGAARVEILLGSGTMANDAVAAQLSLERAAGLIVSNGEFGERLVDHARRWGLDFEALSCRWGAPFDLDDIERRLARARRRRWLWFAHCETSTGVLNDLDGIAAICRRLDVALCVDAISAIGTVPVDLRHVRFASCVSGKGLRSFTGLGMVFCDRQVPPAPAALPRVLDLGLYALEGGVPFTQSSSLVHSLRAALSLVSWADRYRVLGETSTWLRARLERLGFEVVGATARPSPGVVTIALPVGVDSTAVASILQDEGYLVAANSRYLTDRNWIQVSLMGEPSRGQLAGLSTALLQCCADPAGKGAAGTGLLNRERDPLLR